MRIFFLFYFFTSFIIPNLIMGQTQESPLSSKVWKESLNRQANLGETLNALIEKGESNPLFFGYIIGPILKEGLNKYPDSFFEENKILFLFVAQQFRSLKETGFRESILEILPMLPADLQKEISKTELNFLLKVSPKESLKRTREIHIWTKVIKDLPFAKEAFLILLEKTKEPSIRNLLRQSAQGLTN